jgi:hypothetical protein
MREERGSKRAQRGRNEGVTREELGRNDEEQGDTSQISKIRNLTPASVEVGQGGLMTPDAICRVGGPKGTYLVG